MNTDLLKQPAPNGPASTMRAVGARGLERTAFVCGCLIASLARAGVSLPGPAAGRTGLRYAVAEVTLTPAAPRPGGAATLEVRLRPRSGFAWHEARLAPARAVVRAPRGWRAVPAELALPPAEGRDGERRFEASLRAGDEIAGNETLVVELRYAVRRSGESGEGAEAEREVFFEEAELAVELTSGPAADTALEPAAEPVGEPIGEPVTELQWAPPGTAAPGADDGTRIDVTGSLPGRSAGGRGSPALPAVFLALAAALVLGGLAVAVRKARRGR